MDPGLDALPPTTGTTQPPPALPTTSAGHLVIRFPPIYQISKGFGEIAPWILKVI